MNKKFPGLVLFATCLLLLVYCVGPAIAAEQSAEYLKYQEPQSNSSSLLSTLVYLVFLIGTFLVVIALAYATSRFLGQKMVHTAGDNKILSLLSLGSNRAVYVVEIAGRVLILGVTDHAVELLQEVTDPTVVEKLKSQPQLVGSNQFDAIFQKQLVSLQQLSRKFPTVFGSSAQTNDHRFDDREKR